MPSVKLYATLRKLAGTKDVSIAGQTVAIVMVELVKRHPSLRSILLEDGKMSPHILVTLNGHNITAFETPVTEQDHIAVFPPMAGG